MSRTPRHRALLILSAACAAAVPSSLFADSYDDNVTARWTSTATNASIARGSPFTITYSIAPNGVNLGSAYGTNNFISQLDTWYGNTGGNDLTQRPWFINSIRPIFDRFNAVLGANFVYEPGAADGVPGDDGAGFNTNGALGVRGDIRFFGTGASDGTAFGAYPTNGDNFYYLGWNNGSGLVFQNAAQLQFIAQHELGHVMGLPHQQIWNSAGVLNNNGAIIVSGGGNSAGPQFDDLTRLQRSYGDAREKLNGGNDTLATAQSIGTGLTTAAVSVGTGITNNYLIANNVTDITSIDGTSDSDHFSFDVSGDRAATITVEPRGPTSYFYKTEGAAASINVNATAQVNLAFDVYSSVNNALLYSIDNTAVGSSEIIPSMKLPALPAGQKYIVKVRGAEDALQFYALTVAPAAVAAPRSSRLVLNDAFTAADSSDVSTSYAARQAGRINSLFSVGSNDGSISTAALENNQLKLRSVSTASGAHQVFAQTARNLAPELAGQKWTSRFFVRQTPDENPGDNWFAFTFNDGTPTQGPFDASAEMSLLIRSGGGYQLKENAAGGAAGAVTGNSHLVELVVDESGATKLMTVRIDGNSVLTNEPITLANFGRYFGVRTHIGSDSLAGTANTAFVDDFNITTGGYTAAVFNVADGNLNDFTKYSGPTPPFTFAAVAPTSDVYVTNNKTAALATAATIGGDLYLARGDAAIADIYNGSGTLNITAGGNLTLGGGIVLGGTGTTAAVSVIGGTLKTSGPIAGEIGSSVTSSLTLTAGTLDLGGGSIGVSTLTLNSGTLLNAGQLGPAGYTKTAAGTLTIGGTNTFTNALAVNVGTLFITGSTNTSGTTINNDSVLRATNSGAFGTGGVTVNIANANTGRLEIGGGINVLGGKTLTIFARNSSTPAVISTDGNNTIAGNLLLQSGGGNHWVQSDLNSTLHLTGQVSSGGSTRTLTVRGNGNGSIDGPLVNGAGILALAKLDAGSWAVTGLSSTYTGSTLVGGGTLTIARLNNNGGLTVTNGLAQLTTKTASAGSLAVSTVSSGIQISALSVIGPGSALDITNNTLIVEYATTSSRPAIDALVASGFGNGLTNPGIRSSTAAANSRTAVGIADATDLGGAGAIDAVAYDSTSTIIRYTLAGDANLDRSVNSIDFTQLVAGFGTTTSSATPARWFTGDFNYDGSVDTRDFATLVGNFAAALPGIAAGELPGALVPEPASAVLVTCVAMLARRRRRV